MRIYHVYDLKTGEIYYSAPDYRAAVEMRDAAKAAKYKDGSWQIGSTMADEKGCINGEPWYDILSYQIEAVAERKLAPVAGPYRDEIVKEKAVEKNARRVDGREFGRVRGSNAGDTDYSGFGV